MYNKIKWNTQRQNALAITCLKHKFCFNGKYVALWMYMPQAWLVWCMRENTQKTRFYKLSNSVSFVTMQLAFRKYSISNMTYVSHLMKLLSLSLSCSRSICGYRWNQWNRSRERKRWRDLKSHNIDLFAWALLDVLSVIKHAHHP